MQLRVEYASSPQILSKFAVSLVALFLFSFLQLLLVAGNLRMKQVPYLRCDVKLGALEAHLPNN